MSEVWTDLTVYFAEQASTQKWYDALMGARTDDWLNSRTALIDLGMLAQLKDPNDAIVISRLVQQGLRLEVRFMESGLDSRALVDALSELGATHLSAESDDSATGSVTYVYRVGREKVKKLDFIKAVCAFDDPFAFRHAIREGKLNEVKRLLKKGVSPNEPIRGKSYPIHFAVANKQHKIVKLLIESGADLNVQTGKAAWLFESFRTPLHIALSDSKPDVESAMQLIEAGANLELKDGVGKTALHHAIHALHLPLCIAMIGKGADPNPKDAEGYPAIFGLSSSRAAEIPAFLEQAKAIGIVLNQYSEQHGNIRWALGAIQEVADYLDAQGTGVLAPRNAYQQSAVDNLRVAIDARDYAMIASLIAKGVDINAAPSPSTGIPISCYPPALITAVRRHSLRIVRCLISAGADLSVVDEQGRCALHHAARGGELEIVRALLAAGADANQIYSRGTNSYSSRPPIDDAMLFAIYEEHYDIAHELLSHWRPSELRLDEAKRMLTSAMKQAKLAETAKTLWLQLEGISVCSG